MSEPATLLASVPVPQASVLRWLKSPLQPLSDFSDWSDLVVARTYSGLKEGWEGRIDPLEVGLTGAQWCARRSTRPEGLRLQYDDSAQRLNCVVPMVGENLFAFVRELAVVRQLARDVSAAAPGVIVVIEEWRDGLEHPERASAVVVLESGASKVLRADAPNFAELAAMAVTRLLGEEPRELISAAFAEVIDAARASNANAWRSIVDATWMELRKLTSARRMLGRPRSEQVRARLEKRAAKVVATAPQKIAAAEHAGAPSATIAALRAALALGRGDVDGARRLHRGALAVDPNDPVVGWLEGEFDGQTSNTTT